MPPQGCSVGVQAVCACARMRRHSVWLTALLHCGGASSTTWCAERWCAHKGDMGAVCVFYLALGLLGVLVGSLDTALQICMQGVKCGLVDGMCVCLNRRS